MTNHTRADRARRDPRFSSRSRRAGALIAGVAASALSAHAFGAVVVPVSWVLPTSGVWTDVTKWNPAVVPNDGTPAGSQYDVTIGVTGAPYTVSFDATPINVSTLTINTNSATLLIAAGNSLTVSNRLSSAGNIVQTGGTLTTTSGTNTSLLRGAAVYQHTGGTFNFGANLSVGITAGDTARYELSGAGALTGVQLNVGANVGDGTFLQSGGTVLLSQYLALGDDTNNGSTVRGTYALNGGTLTSNNQYVGGSGIGTFTQNGGFNRIPTAGQNFLAVGEDATSNGTYSLNSGTMAISALVLAHFGNGTFIQSGGSNTISGVMRVGRDAGSHGYYSLSAGTLAVSGEADLGYGADTSGGAGTFEQTGGAFNAAGAVYLGKFQNAAGTYKLSAGTFTAGSEFVGSFGSGSFTQTGGTHTVTGALTIAANSGSGALAISGGTIRANSTTLNGSLLASGSSAGTLGAISGVGAMTLTNNAVFAAKSARIGVLSLGNASTLSIAQNGASVATSRVNSLSITGSAVLDLSDNDLIVSSATPAATVRNYLRQGYNFGGFDGTGAIQSSAARNDPTGNKTLGMLTGAEYLNNASQTQFDNLSVLLSDTLVKFTYFGDVDFNGAVDSTDYNIIDFGFLTGASGWANGDVDYSGAVDSTDYNLIDYAFVTQSGMLRRAVSYLDGTDRSNTGMSDQSLREVVQHFDQFGEPYAAGFLANVPEPTMISLAAVTATGAMLRRRRREAR